MDVRGVFPRQFFLSRGKLRMSSAILMESVF